MMQTEIKTWDIFCKVIDNYGDIGVCWRLARQLANEYPFQIRLWVDELPALIQIWPSTQDTEQQLLENVDVRIWREIFDANVAPADVVIEAFACDLPSTYLAAMKHKTTAPYWFNLEYLSAEDWVEGCHGLPSTHPQLGLKKTFFFPGFTAQTGGLPKEKQLLNDRDAFIQSENTRVQFLHQLGIQLQPNELLISLFAYENDAIASLLSAWAVSSTPILCLVPASKILPRINTCIGKDLNAGDEFSWGSLRLVVIPFVTQDDYDRLLWSCDVNFVRGEDSFVRAHWAAKPFIWHIYPQDDDIHMVKLVAFLKHYLKGLEPELQGSITQLWHCWNRSQDCEEVWSSSIQNLVKWQNHCQNWCLTLDSLGDLAANMIASVDKSRQKTL
jgi:uncharacterized repeat protein (TIGR03837 family)